MFIRKESSKYILYTYFFISAFIILVSSCGVKNYQKGVPFVYENKIKVNGDFSKTEKKQLEVRLRNQLDDSMKVVIKQSFLVFERRINPPRFDSLALANSSYNMKTLMNSLGHYRAAVKDTFRFDTITPQQIRTISTFEVNAGKKYLLDNVVIGDSLADSGLRELANASAKESLLKKGGSFTEDKVINELDRLVTVFRNNGFYNITRDKFYAEIDSVYKPLLNPDLDPFERIVLLNEYYKRNENPTVDVIIKLRPGVDTASLKPFYVRNVRIYPNFKGERVDTSKYKSRDKDGFIYVYYDERKFKTSFLSQHVYLKQGQLFNQQEYDRTQNGFAALGPWQVVNMQIAEVKDSSAHPNDSSFLDVFVFLTTSPKYNFSTAFEVTSTTSGLTSVSTGRLIGAALNFSLINKNFGKEGIQMRNSIRTGAEFGGSKVFDFQSGELTFTNDIVVPRFLFSKVLKKIAPKWLVKKSESWDNKKTVINSGISYIDRFQFFRIRSINSAIGFEFTNKKKAIWAIRPLNLEYLKFLERRPAFDDLITEFPFLKYSFNEGLVLGSSFSYLQQKKSSKKSNIVNSIRITGESSGLISGLFLPLLKNTTFAKDLFQYVKADVEIKKQINYPKSSLVFRSIAGFGWAWSADPNKNATLPFFKQYVGGGQNSMRGWPLRGIGQGGRALDPRTGGNQFFNRTGDILFETNAEYRYDIATLIPNTLILRGAVFTDIGNIWNWKKNFGNDTAIFKFHKLYDQLSVSGGTGLRFDFLYFILRFDFGLRFKLPYDVGGGWQFPKVTFNKLFGKGKLVPDPNTPGEMINDERYRQWRYDNFNFSIGIGYPF